MIKHTDYLFEIQIPCEDFYVASFIVVDDNQVIIVDSGCSKKDVDKYIIPALDELNLKPTDLVISHTHFDHIGGMTRILNHFKHIKLHTYNDSYLNNPLQYISKNVAINYYPGHPIHFK